MLNVLSTAGFVEKTMMRIADRIEERLRQRAKDTLEVGCILFSNDYGELSRSAAATDLECRLKGVRS
jgi:cobalt-precorrin-5B (C1)-methyltransferase